MHSFDRTLLAKLGFADQDKKERRHDWACQYLAQPEVAARLAAFLGVPRTRDRWVNGVPSWEFEYVETETHLTKGEDQYKTTIGFLDVVISYEAQGEVWVKKALQESHGGEWPLLGFAQPAELDVRTEPTRDGVSRILEFETDEEASACAAELPGAIFRKGWRAAPDGPWGVGSKPSIAVPMAVPDVSGNFPWPWSSDDGKRRQLVTRVHGPRFIRGKGWAVQAAEWEEHECQHFAAELLGEVKIHPVTVGDMLRQINLYREYGKWRVVVIATAFDLTERDVETLRAGRVQHVKLGAGFEEFCQRMQAPAAAAKSLEL